MEHAQVSVSLSLPWPPSTNRIWRNFGGRQVIAKPVRMWREKALAEALRQGPAGFGDAKVGVELRLHPPTRRALDIDNRAKAVLDMLQDAKVFDDDNQVDVLIIQRGEIQKGGRAVVKVWKLDP